MTPKTTEKKIYSGRACCPSSFTLFGEGVSSSNRLREGCPCSAVSYSGDGVDPLDDGAHGLENCWLCGTTKTETGVGGGIHGAFAKSNIG